MTKIEDGYYVQDGMRQLGPLSIASLRELYSRREISSQSLVWRPGDSAWTPLPVFMDELGASTHLAHSLRGAASKTRKAHVAIACLGLAVAIYSLSRLFQTKSVTAEMRTLEEFDSFYLFYLAGMVLGGAVAAYAIWKASSSQHEPYSTLGRVSRLIAVLSLVVWLPVWALYIAIYPSARANFAGTLLWSDYEFAYSNADLGLKISGDIGRGFANALSKQLALHPDTRFVELESNGGLVDEALDAATAIETAQLDTFVARYCQSACVIMFAAGKTRWAKASAFLGFHDTYPLTRDRFSDFVFSTSHNQSADYLRRHGVPELILSKGKGLKQNEMYRASPAELRNAGFEVEILQ